MLDITSSIYISSQGKLACGREDGSIVIVAAVYCLSLQLLEKDRHNGGWGRWLGGGVVDEEKYFKST